MFYKNIKAVLLLCLAALMASPVFAQVSSLTVTRTGVEGNYTLSWGDFAPTYSLMENGVAIREGNSSTYKTFSGKAPGTYQYMVTSCGYPYYGYQCITSNMVTVVVASSSTPPPPPPPPASTPTLQFSIANLQQFMNGARGEDKALASLIGDEIRDRLRSANLSLDEDGLTYSENLPNMQIQSGCSKNVQLRNLWVNATLDSSSRFDLIMDSLSKPIIASAQLIGTIEAGGTARVRLGFKVFGECIRYVKASVDASARTDFTLNSSLMIKLNPTRVLDAPAGQLVIRIAPEVKLTGNMSAVNNVNLSNASLSVLGVDLFSGVIGNVLERYVLSFGESWARGRLNDVAISANSRLGQYLAQQEASILRKLREDIPQEYVIPVNSTLENEMLSFVSYYALNYFPPAGFLQSHSTEILYYLLTGDENALRQQIGTSLACNSSADLLMLNMSKAAAPSPFRATTRAEFCGKIDNKAWLGNAEPAVSGYTGQDSWTLTPPTSFNLSAVAPIQNNYQPYMRRVHYRTINGISDGSRRVVDTVAYGQAMSACYAAGMGYCANPPNIDNYSTWVPIPRGTGSCKLEMRIYKKDVAQIGLKPLMAIHGGAWKYRGAAFYGMESQLSHFTEQGFVVFAPFYRLTGDVDGNIECNKATGADIVSDIDAALTWVGNNMTAYGVSSGQKIRLFGQSGGSLLAGWLVTHRPTQVQKALLMYPPTDAQDYIVNYQAFVNNLPYSSDYAGAFEGQGVEAVEAYLATTGGTTVSLSDISPNSGLVLDNSLPGIVAGSPSYYPPVYMVHGKVDRLVPSIQSVRLCNAYTGDPASGPASNSGTAARQSYTCGPSRVDLLQEANHGLELCLPPLRCEAGASTAALAAAQQSLTAARQWLAQ